MSLSAIAAPIWNEIAKTQPLATEWGKEMFPLDPEQRLEAASAVKKGRERAGRMPLENSPFPLSRTKTSWRKKLKRKRRLHLKQRSKDMMIPMIHQLKPQIIQAMRDQSPSLYLDLKKTGRLDQYVENLGETMLDEYDREFSQAAFEISQERNHYPHLKTIQLLTEAQNRIWLGILQTYLEFPEETTTESSLES